MKPPSRTTVNVAFLACGVLALGWLVRSVGLGQIWAQLRQVGPAFGWVLLAEALSNVFSSRGWWCTFTRSERPPFWRILLTSLASLSVAGMLPTGQAGEIAKANLLRGHVRSPEIVSSLLLFNVLHVLIVAVVSTAGLLIPLATGTFPSRVLLILFAAGFLVIASMILAGAALRLQLVERGVNGLRRLHWRWLPTDAWMADAVAIDDRLRVIPNADKLWSCFWLFWGRIAAIVEIAIILHTLGMPASLSVAMTVFAATTLANYVLGVLPAREGFLEGSTYAVFGWLGLSATGGLSLELVRRLRKIVFQLLGVMWMVVLTKLRREPEASSSPEAEAP